jgi:hypothetical protein
LLPELSELIFKDIEWRRLARYEDKAFHLIESEDNRFETRADSGFQKKYFIQSVG